jgi:ferredoxin
MSSNNNFEPPTSSTPDSSTSSSSGSSGKDRRKYCCRCLSCIAVCPNGRMFKSHKTKQTHLREQRLKDLEENSNSNTTYNDHHNHISNTEMDDDPSYVDTMVDGEYFEGLVPTEDFNSENHHHNYNGRSSRYNGQGKMDGATCWFCITNEFIAY